MDDFNSEIPGYSYSIPSEPPDIRNWFSSYKYESFVLDTCENFGGFYSEEGESDKYESAIEKLSREKEENIDGCEEIRKADESENFKEDSLQSLSVISEPSDIRKWYSSYVYESPLLDTNDGLNSYVSIESECEKDALVNEESTKDESDQSQQNASDNKVSSTKLVKCNSSLVDKKNESHPLFSEPLDIGNWFPDYVYESPVLDTNDGFNDTLPEDTETESSQDKFTVEDSMGQKQDNFKTLTKSGCRDDVVIGEDKCLNGFEQENKCTSKALHWGGVKQNLPWQGDVCYEENLEPNLEFKQELSSSVDGGDSLSELNRVESQSLDISIRPAKTDEKSSNKFIDRKGSIDKSSETKVQTDTFDIRSHNQSLPFDQVAGKDIGENGFITTKKNKIMKTNDENSRRGHGEILLQSSRKTIGGEKDNGVMKRKVLAETTNVNVERHCEAKAMEITGKWRCPQKSKPIRGPPLKQLRLERWVHRV